MTASRRLLLAAVLCAVSLGLGWSASDSETSLQSTFVPGTCVTDYDGYMSCSTGEIGWYYNTTFGYTTRGYADDARVVLVPAALGLAWASRRRSAASERVVRIAGIALVAISLRAGTEGQTTGAMVGVLAAWLTFSALRAPRAVRTAGPPAGAADRSAPAMAPATPGGAF